jgi:holo-[acyl-carrier protein] synthase
MIGIGTDIVEISRIEAVLARHPERFARRILVAAELERLRASAEPARYLARRFAAKEAVAKAFGTGIGAHLAWHDLEVANCPSGAPQVHLSLRGAGLLASLGGARVLVSLSDERAYAVAFAVVLK